MSGNGVQLSFHLNLKDYDVSDEVGFLVPEPATELPPYFEPWSKVIENLENMINEKQLRKYVDDEMPQLGNCDEIKKHLSMDREIQYKQLRLAYMYLTFIGSGYIWQDDDVPQVIPEQLAIPWYSISEYLGLQPVPCMASVVLNNYQKIDSSKPLNLDNLKAICTFPVTKGSEWFFILTVQVEIDAVKGIKAVLAGKKAVTENSNKDLLDALNELKVSIDTMTKTCTRMGERLTGHDFYNVVRRYLAGYGFGSSKLPDGILFKGASTEPVRAIGGSAAQSSTVQCFDVGLGMNHKPGEQEYLTMVRDYMPPKHKDFILALAEGQSIRRYVESSDDDDLKLAFDEAVKELTDFRNYHMQMARMYIKVPASEKNGPNHGAEKGTGGTDFMDFLKSIRDTTKESAFG